MKVIFSVALILLAPVHVRARKRASIPADARVVAVRKVYVTGRKRHEVRWARKHLGHYTCLHPVSIVDQADGILDLEPVDASPPVEYAGGPTGVITCRSRNAGSSSSARDGETTCTSKYFDPSGVENVLAAGAEALERSAETHAYLLSKDGKEVLWDFDESLPENQSILHPGRDMWSRGLKDAASCRKR
jgi:hypothetical protein